MTIKLQLLTTSNVDDLYPRLRIEDKEETVCLGSNPREALLLGAFDNMFPASSGRAYGLWDGSELIGAIGFSSAGYLWALSTKFTRSQRKELFLRTGEIVERLTREATSTGAISPNIPTLHNLIHARNKPAIKWLQKSGLFEVDLDNPVESAGEIFYNFRTLMPHELKAPRLGGSYMDRMTAACASPQPSL